MSHRALKYIACFNLINKRTLTIFKLALLDIFQTFSPSLHVRGDKGGLFPLQTPEPDHFEDPDIFRFFSSIDRESDPSKVVMALSATGQVIPDPPQCPLIRINVTDPSGSGSRSGFSLSHNGWLYHFLTPYPDQCFVSVASGFWSYFAKVYFYFMDSGLSHAFDRDQL